MDFCADDRLKIRFKGVENKLRDDACFSVRAAVLLDVVMKRYKMSGDGGWRMYD